MSCEDLCGVLFGNRPEFKLKLVYIIAALAIGTGALTLNADAAGRFRDCASCPDMIALPPGTFEMGAADDTGRTAPIHTVTIAQPFAVSRTEITVDEYTAFVEATGRADGPGCYGRDATGARANIGSASWRTPGIAQQGTHPVVCVSFADAVAYTEWLSARTGTHYRLLSEAEWEYAARAGTNTKWYWGEDAAQACEYANVPDTYPCDDDYADTAPVGTFTPNAFGLHDMLGNVWEWVADCWHPTYDGAPTDGSAWIEDDACTIRTVRGQGFGASNTEMSAAARSADPVSYRGIGLGFRVGKDLDANAGANAP